MALGSCLTDAAEITHHWVVTEDTRAQAGRRLPLESWADWYHDPNEADREEAKRARPQFERATAVWLCQHHPTMAGRGPVLSRFITYPCSGQRAVVFEEFDKQGRG